MQSETVLLTGATGFLGSHVLEGLIEKGFRVIVLKRSFSDTWRICRLLDKVKVYDIDTIPIENPFKENGIDVIFHAATNYGRENAIISDVVNSNLVFPLHLLDLAALYKVSAFLNIDTFYTSDYSYATSYALSKEQLREWLPLYSNKVQIINLKVQHLVGPKDAASKFVMWLIAQLFEGKDELKLTSGEQKRDFIYVTDVVRAGLFILASRKGLNNYSEFEAGTGELTSIREFVIKTSQAVAKVTGNEPGPFLDFGALPYRKGEFMEVEGNIEGLNKLGWMPEVSLDESIMKTVAWYNKRRLS